MFWPAVLFPKAWRQFFWRGSLGKCTVCESEIRSWQWRGHSYPIVEELEIVGSGRRKVDCPVCGSSDRDRLVWEYLQSQLPSVQVDDRFSVLHVAPERCIADRLKEQKHLHYVGVDKKSKGYYYPKWVMHADITKPFVTQPENFDIILCNHVMEHVSNDGLALNVLISKLKPGGQLILSVPMAHKLTSTRESNTQIWEKLTNSEKIQQFGQSDHFRIYGTDVLERWQALTADFKGTWLEYTSNHNHTTQKLFSLNPKERLIIYFHE